MPIADREALWVLFREFSHGMSCEPLVRQNVTVSDIAQLEPDALRKMAFLGATDARRLIDEAKVFPLGPY